jgi:hypothetical protein
VIDISGDGRANLGLPPAAARDRIVRHGIVINGLTLPGAEPWIATYYRDNVIGGAGAFVLEARSGASFAEATLRKLVQEVATGASGGTSAMGPKPDSKAVRAIGQMQ